MPLSESIKSITVKAPVNIAVIKYWGKTDEEQILALNDSISGTLNIDQLCAHTSVASSSSFKEDRMWLNGQEQSISKNKRLQKCLVEIRKLSPASFKNQPIHICSRNNFPTAAGLASSAAGYACLVFALGQLLQVTDRRTLSILARQGSGSACRSLYGGFVRWVAGPTSEQSYADQVVDQFHWPQMRVLVLVVSDKTKDTSSTSGMKLSVETSSLIQFRVRNVLPARVESMSTAIKNRDFGTFARLTMQDSNQFHAICQDTYPPIKYMNDISWSIVRLVHKFNEFYGRERLAYTFDAGPNACIYLLEDTVDEFLSLVHRLYPTRANNYTGAKPVRKEESIERTIRDESNQTKVLIEKVIRLEYPDFKEKENVQNSYYRGLGHRQVEIDPNLLDSLNQLPQPEVLQGIISTSIGTGPILVESNESLLNNQGLPN